MKVKVAVFLLSVGLVAIGFNTLDAMVNQFFWSDYWRRVNGWSMIPNVVWNWWLCYILFGILPLVAGCILVGFEISLFKKVKA